MNHSTAEEIKRLHGVINDLRQALAAIYLVPHSEQSDRESVLQMLRTARWGLDRAESALKESSDD
jgi:hypothetical protein